MMKSQAVDGRNGNDEEEGDMYRCVTPDTSLF